MTVPAGGAVLPVDKPVGPTSHDIVQRARRALGVRRVGHTGTLDPFASGLMLLCVGPATRLSQYLTGEDKEYVARARLGVSTDTLDREGRVVAESDAWRQVTRGDVEGALVTLRGTIEQRPPVFSAKKVRGEAAHRRSRRGEDVSLPTVQVVIHELELTGMALPEIELRVVCSSGTYIRALARDLGDALGVGAHLVALRRTHVGAHRVEDAVPGDFREPISVGKWITPLDALAGWTRVEVDEGDAVRISHGQSVSAGTDGETERSETGPIAVHFRGQLLSVARMEGGVIRPEKVFPQALEAVS